MTGYPLEEEIKIMKFPASFGKNLSYFAHRFRRMPSGSASRFGESAGS
ncbi:MAG: hypothetical protein GX485_00615 [Clostridiales bacterium]|jgi:hypothetical protein|nr:hypothetical protein [Clostridiales bacterium]